MSLENHYKKFNKLTILKYLLLAVLILLSLNLVSQTDMPSPINADTQKPVDLNISPNVKESFNISSKNFSNLSTAKKETGVIGLTKAINAIASGNITKGLGDFAIDTPAEFESLIFTKCNEYGCDPYQVIRVMYCESKANVYATNGRYSGLFQQDSRYWSDRSLKYGAAGSDIYDAYAQIQVATKMFSLGMSSHWGCK